MRDKAYILKYLLFAIAQVLIWNYCNFTQFLTLTILPVMIFSLPVRMSSALGMLIAFLTGAGVDFLCGAPLGLSSAAIVPVAAAKRLVVVMVFGSELLSREENPGFKRHGWVKMTLAISILTALFLLIYILADSAGTRPLWIDAVKFGVSLLAGILISIPVAASLCAESVTPRWK